MMNISVIVLTLLHSINYTNFCGLFLKYSPGPLVITKVQIYILLKHLKYDANILKKTFKYSLKNLKNLQKQSMNIEHQYIICFNMLFLILNGAMNVLIVQ